MVLLVVKILGATRFPNVLKEWNDIAQEPMSRSLQLPYLAYVTAFLQTELFLVHLFFCERKAVPVH